VSARNQNINEVVEPLIASLHAMLPIPSAPQVTLGSLPVLLDRAIAAGASKELRELATMFPTSYAFFFILACDADIAGDHEEAARGFARARALLEHLDERCESEESLLADLRS
jgi:hypothetical protein